MPKRQAESLLQQVDDIVRYLTCHHEALVEEIGKAFSITTLSVTNAEYEHQNIEHSLSHYVEQKAVEMPDGPAVAFSSRISTTSSEVTILTYSKLNKRANSLAHVLKEYIHSDDVVCILMEKSLDLYVSILATVKTGNGYLPIIPETPEDRVRLILQEAGAKVC